MGTIITFYSYKGGVGRTMALANIAVLLAKWGKRVLVVDWDLEAPGVEHFFKTGDDLASLQKRKGLIDILTGLSESENTSVKENDWLPLVAETNIKGIETPIHLLTAGARSQGYFGSVRKLDVKDFYETKNGGHIIEGLRNSWKSRFDFILVDSRTGITDIGGICTIQLPDILAIIFTATEQSLTGAINVAKTASVRRQELPFDRALVPVVPIPSRFDTQTEHEISKRWLEHFEKALGPLYDQWLPRNTIRRDFLSRTKIPYTPYFSFGEPLPVIEQGTVESTGLGYAYETLAALLGNNLEHADLILTNRDEFIQLARVPGRLPKVPLREFAWDTLLYVDLVGGNTLQAAFERKRPADKTSEETFADYQCLISKITRQQGGELVQSDGLSFLFAFPESQRALAGAVEIQASLAVKSPVTGPLGALSVRMAVHSASKSMDAQKQPQQDLVQIVTRIAGRANEGEILISADARKLITQDDESLKFEPQPSTLEVPIQNGGVTLIELYQVVSIVPVNLSPAEHEYLFEQDPGSRSGGGFQALLVALQDKVKNDNLLELTISDRERIARYAHDYHSGGWQGRLRKIFGRTLGMNLGRELTKH